MKEKPLLGKRPDQVRLSVQRKRLFLLITILLPFLLLGLLEIGLRLGEYGGNLNLVIKRKAGAQEFYWINRSVAKRYFAQAGTTIPEPAEDTFEIKKQKNTKRIFCLGESTMAGFPFEFHATAPGFLRDRIQTLLPQYNVEVINVGLSAVSSFVVLDFLNELLDYEPDLFIVYVGHNEFYGAYGVGSTVAMKGGPWMTRLTLSLLKFKTFVLLRDVYAGILKLFSSPAGELTGSMMGQMAANKTIAINSTPYNDAKDIYKQNLTKLIESTRSKNVPILFSSLVSNWKDQAPFVNVFAATTSEGQKLEWQRLLGEGDTAVAHHQISLAKEKYEASCKIDTLAAAAFFKLGNALYSLQRFDEARHAFLRAKDLDALRFRATEEFQQTLIGTCNQFGVSIARVDSAYVLQSPHGIVGNELIMEHLHPNIEGYFLMGKVIANVVRQNNLLVPQSEWRMDLNKSDADFFELSTVSEFDRAVGKLKVEFLKRRWPFNTGPTNFAFIPANSVESVAFRYVQQQIAWSDARYKLAEFYANNKRFDLARKECLAVSKVIPFSYNPLLRVADYYRMEGKHQEAKKAYERCLSVEDNPYARIKLGITYLEEGDASQAATELNLAFERNRNFGEPLSIEASSAARYLLGVAYAKTGKFQEAKEQVDRAIAINPNNMDARDLLKQIESFKK